LSLCLQSLVKSRRRIGTTKCFVDTCRHYPQSFVDMWSPSLYNAKHHVDTWSQCLQSLAMSRSQMGTKQHKAKCSVDTWNQCLQSFVDSWCPTFYNAKHHVDTWSQRLHDTRGESEPHGATQHKAKCSVDTRRQCPQSIEDSWSPAVVVLTTTWTPGANAFNHSWRVGATTVCGLSEPRSL
jgi:hypothetical protein